MDLIELEMAKSTAGPGVKVVSKATLKKTSQFESVILNILIMEQSGSILPEHLNGGAAY